MPSRRLAAYQGALPETGIACFAETLARAHEVSYVRIVADNRAEQFTRLSGDAPVQDATCDLLVNLCRAGVLNPRQLALLTIRHAKERKSLSNKQ